MHFPDILTQSFLSVFNYKHILLRSFLDFQINTFLDQYILSGICLLPTICLRRQITYIFALLPFTYNMSLETKCLRRLVILDNMLFFYNMSLETYNISSKSIFLYLRKCSKIYLGTLVTRPPIIYSLNNVFPPIFFCILRGSRSQLLF